MRNRRPYQSERCPECGAVHTGSPQCANCGCTAQPAGREEWSAEKMSKAAKVYTGVFVAWALLFPFLLPIILKASHIYQ